MVVQYVVLSLITVVLLTVEIVLGRWLAVGTPHLIFALLLSLCLVGQRPLLTFYVVLSGFLLDLVPGSLPGFHLLVFSVTALILIFLQRSFFHQPTFIVTLIIFFIFSLIFETLLGITYGGVGWIVVIPAVTTTLIALIFYRVIGWFGNSREVLLHA